jgi:hypothetical protein
MCRIAILAFLLWTVSSEAIFAQSITIDSVVGSRDLCIHDQITVYFTARGTFNDGNAFYLVLCGVHSGVIQRGNGSWQMSGEPGVWFPRTNCTLQVVSTDPPVTALAQDAYSVSWPPTIYLSSKKVVSEGEPYSYSASVTTYGPPYRELWNFGPHAQPSESTDTMPSVIYMKAGKKSVSIVATEYSDCSTSSSMEVTVLSCTPLIPKSATHITRANQQNIVDTGHYFWIDSGASYFSTRSDDTIFCEPGSSVTSGANTLIYLRSGASYFGQGGNCSAVYTPGAIITFADNKYPCASLQFDSSEVQRLEVQYEDRNEGVERLSVYPDPAHEHVRISANSEIRMVCLVNLLGQVVSVREGIAEPFTELLLDVSAGIYEVIARTQHGIATRRLIVQ